MKIKNLLIALILPGTLLFSSCGQEGNKEKEGADQESQKEQLPEILKGMEPLDLSEHGFPLILMIPDSTMGKPEVTAQSWGDTEIRVGDYYQLQIRQGEGDLELKKKDIAEDLLYKSEYVVEKDSAILYKSVIEGSNLDPMYHFYMIRTIGGKPYVIQDIQAGDAFPEKAAKRMFEAAKHIKPASEKAS